ncbi:MAG: glycoside hydrolase, partial [Bacteroidota bacterium]
MKLNKFANTMMIMLIIFMCEKNVSAQHNIPVFGNQNLLNGYTKDITGEVWPYYSSSPIFAKEALLTRCTDGKKTISWETENAPAKLDKDYYYFYWLSGHSSGTSVAVSTFSLSINGTNYLSFKIPLNEKPPLVWNVSGKDSVAVVFSATKTDVCKDLFGGMYLRVPRKLLTPGKPLYLSITGNAEKRNDWFMVFKYNYSEKVLVRPTPFLVYTDKGIKQQIQLSVDHIFPEIKHLTVIINNNTMDFPVTEGSNDVLLPLDTVVKPTQLHIIVKNGSTVIKEFDVLQSPVQHKEVDIIAHSHNDIGYSHVQEEVMKVQQKNIMDALDMIDRTKNFPDGSRFVWNEETLWPVEYFLNHANEYNKERFIRAVKNNSIALSAFYVGVMTGLCSAEEIRWICEYAVYLKSKYGFNINTAMLSDIPGISWSTVDALNNSGVSYLSNGPNDGERLGTLYQYLGDKPCYWKSTDGKGKVLLWTAGLGYSAFHSVPFEELGNKMKEKLTNYLGVLDSSHYPYDMVQLRYTIKSDNGPLDTNLSNFVRDWNAKYASPKLNIANVGDMMSRFEKKYGNTLPVLSGDFTPYWEDGAYSTAAEEGENRILSDRVAQLEKFATTHPERLLHNNWFYEARKNVVMFHEHTWGAWNSTSEPD